MSIIFSMFVLSAIYFHNVNICESVVLSVNDTEAQCYAISPTGGQIEFVRDSCNNNYTITTRYLHDIYIITPNFNSFEAKLSIGPKTFELDKNSLLVTNDCTYKIKRDILPHNGLFMKFSYINKNLNINLFNSYLDLLIKITLYFIGFLLSFFLIRNIIKYWKRDMLRIKTFMIQSFKFIKTEWVKIILLFIISIIFPLLYLLFDKNVIDFLYCTTNEYLLVFGSVIFPLIFMAFYAKKFKLNQFYWISLLVIFILLVFVLKPLIFIYGFGFRDDISKFFVKAHTQNLLKCFFTPDSGYLNVLQNVISYFLLKILGFKHYFPEALQISVAFCFATLFASFNLKSLRVFIRSDLYRFFISLLFAFSPFVFTSSNYLFEIPFVAVAFMFMFYFSYFQKQIDKNNKSLAFLIFVSIIMFLSKPIFVILIPILIALIIYQYFINKNIVLTRAFVFIVLVLSIQMIVVLSPSNQIQGSALSDLGTNYESAFIVDSPSFFNLLPAAIVLFIRHFVKLFGLAYVDNNYFNLIINTLSFLFIAALIFHYLYKIYKRKDIFISSFCISALVISFMTVILFVNVVNPANIDANNRSFLSMTFYNMISQPVLPKYHRYLMLSSFANFIVLLIFVFEIIEKFFFSMKIRNILKMSFLLIISFIPLTNLIKYYNNANSIYEKNSYWRNYNSLIFDNPKAYYIPYNGFPEQKHCVKFRTDKIIDIEKFNGNIINISELYPRTNTWQIIQLILLNDDTNNYPVVEALTTQKTIVRAKLVNGKTQQMKSLVYQFDDFYKFEKIFITFTVPEKKYCGLVRIIGLYE